MGARTLCDQLSTRKGKIVSICHLVTFLQNSQGSEEKNFLKLILKGKARVFNLKMTITIVIGKNHHNGGLGRRAQKS